MDKIYCGNARVIETKYGAITKVSMHKDDINKIVKHMKDEQSDWVNIDILQKKAPDEGKPTHYLVISTYEPPQKEAAPISEPKKIEGLPF